MKATLPNGITLINLFLGSVAVIALLNQQTSLAFACTLACLLADLLDGLVARSLNVQSPLGRELDSLADVISFGLVPGVLIYCLMASLIFSNEGLVWGATPALVLTAFSALRLGRFNLDTRQSEDFIGLPTPACTILVWGLSFWIERSQQPLFRQLLFFYLLIALLSYLLVSPLPLFSLKFKKLKWPGNEIKIIFVLLSVVLLVYWWHLALAPIIVLYLVMSLVDNFLNRKTSHEI